MSTPTTIYHGLSVLSDADASQRLAHPLAATVKIYRIGSPSQTFNGPRQVFNVFNDALTQLGYQNPDLLDHPAGHPGIDYLCAPGQEVKAMYSGVVTEINDLTKDAIPQKTETIQSCTNPNLGRGSSLGFKIQYGHLDQYVVRKDEPVKKRQVLGRSGSTGTFLPHLHMEFQAFYDSGRVDTNENVPPKDNLLVDPPVAVVAQRIRGGEVNRLPVRPRSYNCAI